MSEYDLSRPELCYFADANEDADDHPSIDIYDVEDVRRLLSSDELEDSPDFASDGRSQEEELWRRRLRSLIKYDHSAKRDLLIANEPMIQRLNELKKISPHFSQVIDLVLRAAKLSLAAKSPLLIPPLLLVGAPGVGKSFVARNMAKALNTHIEHVALDLLSDHGVMTGLSLSWKAARPGRIAKALIASRTASPIFYCDEVDKVNPIHIYEKPLSFLHTVLEPENAKRFQDEYFTIPMRADLCLWILTANTIESLAPSIVDRLTVIHIEKPTSEQLGIIAKGIYRQVNDSYNRAFVDEASNEVIEVLSHINPRTTRKLLEVALAFAYDSGRDHLAVSDIESASHLILMKENALKIGFL